MNGRCTAHVPGGFAAHGLDTRGPRRVEAQGGQAPQRRRTTMEHRPADLTELRRRAALPATCGIVGNPLNVQPGRRRVGGRQRRSRAN